MPGPRSSVMRRRLSGGQLVDFSGLAFVLASLRISSDISRAQTARRTELVIAPRSANKRHNSMSPAI